MTGLNSRSRRFLLATAVSLAILSAVFVATSGRATRTPLDASSHFWGMLAIDTLEAEHYESLVSMTGGSETVVLGRITDVRATRSFGGPEDAEQIRLAALEVSILKVLHGQLKSEQQTIDVEVTLPGGRTVAQLKDAIPAEEALFFLRNKGTEAIALGMTVDQVKAEVPYYRLVSSQGLIRSIAGAAIPPDGPDDAFSADLRGTPFDSVQEQVAGIKD